MTKAQWIALLSAVLVFLGALTLIFSGVLSGMVGTDGGVYDAGLDGGLADAGGNWIEPGSAGVADVAFAIRSDTERHPISPLIYGVNQDDTAGTTRPGLIRCGGNRYSAYNWANNASNAGIDYGPFSNDNFLGGGSAPAGAVQLHINRAAGLGGAAMVTVPLGDYVAADIAGGNVEQTANYLSVRFSRNHASKGAQFSLSPPAGPDVYQDEFVNALRISNPATRIVFSLDNEPDLWPQTHPEIHPASTTYAELLSRTISTATAIKAAWPKAEVAGPVSYGWYGFVTLQGAPDGAGRDFLNYYLDSLKSAEASAGHRLVDYLDVHWYPEATGGGTRIIGTDTSSAVVAARVQAPRSLWDSGFVESSWISTSLGQKAIALLPLLRAKVASHYLGTKLAITEWNYGAGQDISGGLATADVLGVFGWQGLELATYWRLQSAEPFAEAAFAAFRNYDGAGATFGDTSIRAGNSDAVNTSVYASVDAATGRMVLVAINKTGTARTAGVTIAHSTKFSGAMTWTLTANSPQMVAGPAPALVDINAFRLSLPPLSVTVLSPR